MGAGGEVRPVTFEGAAAASFTSGSAAGADETCSTVEEIS